VYRKALSSLKDKADELNEEPGKYRTSTAQVPRKHRASTAQVEEERIQKLMEFCSVPRKRSEMQEFLGLTHREYFRMAILVPMIERGLIELTIPEKPSSSKQKYVRSVRP
jgi:ATP-dependent DNA helicase RecG